MLLRKLLPSFLLGCFLFSEGLIADSLKPPSGPVILVVSGAIQHTNVGDEAHFDRSQLEALQQRTTLTQTPWTEQQDHYSGPLGRALVAAVGAQDAEWMSISALNDYHTEVPVKDFDDYPVILAMKKNDRYLRVRDRGPLFVIYPFDEQPHLKTEMHYNRSAWQVKAIEFR